MDPRVASLREALEDDAKLVNNAASSRVSNEVKCLL